ncbi:ZmpA/ZmpB/ZmpC family metallo-endopeptidase-related protein, partial [Endozoicomonas sp. ONNA2]|uniref:ZmpA/ZmpB/ZmpC family metallo-endopeptidase-related protein n=1 Tax=Endozoicomonas sp. ONNA2 TaxID=2828741 RepID=UPI00214803A3
LNFSQSSLRALFSDSLPGALVGLSAVGAASASASDFWDYVWNVKTPGNICRDKDTCSKQYRLIDDIDGSKLPRSIGDKDNPFTDRLDVNSRTICNLLKCLIKHLSAGRIENLTLSDARIFSEDKAGVVACEMSGNAMINNIRVERDYVTTNGADLAPAAIGVGFVNGELLLT